MRLRYSLKAVLFVPLILVLFCGAACAGEQAQFTGEINARDINLRVDATTNSAVISVLDKGERVEVVLEMYDWYKVRLPKEVVVYIKKGLAKCIKSTEPENMIQAEPAAPRCLSAKLLADRVNVRLKPDESALIVGIADKGEVVNVISEAGDWYKIEPIQNSFGWVYKKFVNKAVVVDKPPQETQMSQSQTGVSDNPDKLSIFTGTVMPYGVVFLRKATHKLVSPDNKVFLLKGNRASLDALNYEKVKVIGKIIGSPEVKTPLVEVKIIEVMN
ncbi:MAG: SH3 domain-containing protein [Candidatus Omnitrophota bacterium]